MNIKELEQKGEPTILEQFPNGATLRDIKQFLEKIPDEELDKKFLVCDDEEAVPLTQVEYTGIPADVPYIPAPAFVFYTTNE